MAPCPIQRRRAVLLCSSDYDRKKFRTAACSVSPAAASYDGRSSTYSAQTWVLEKQALQKKQNSEVRGQSTDRLVCATVHDLQTGWIWTPCYTERWDQNAFGIFQYFFQLGTIFISTYVVKNGGFSTQISSLAPPPTQIFTNTHKPHLSRTNSASSLVASWPCFMLW